MSNNHAEATLVARRDELMALLRAAVPVVARQIMVAVPHTKRTTDESQFLRDCARTEERRNASPETLAKLLEIGARVTDTQHALSEAIRKIETGIAPAPVECFYDASEAEQVDDASLDNVQLKAARTKSPAYLRQIAELGPKVIVRIRRMVDAANRALSARPA